MATTHELKTWPEFWDAVSSGEKKFEVRKNDRGFQKGDLLILMKYDPKKGRDGDYVRHITDNSPYRVEKRIKYVLSGGMFGIAPDYVVLGF